MFTPEILTDTVIEWFSNLDYEFMVLHIIVCYGLYYSNNLKWVVERFSPVRKKGLSKAVWVVGGVLAIMEIGRFLPYMGDDDLIIQKIVSIVHSYIVVQVFVEYIVKFVHNWIKILKRETNE